MIKNTCGKNLRSAKVIYKIFCWILFKACIQFNIYNIILEINPKKGVSFKQCR